MAEPETVPRQMSHRAAPRAPWRKVCGYGLFDAEHQQWALESYEATGNQNHRFAPNEDLREVGILGP